MGIIGMDGGHVVTIWTGVPSVLHQNTIRVDQDPNFAAPTQTSTRGANPHLKPCQVWISWKRASPGQLVFTICLWPCRV